MVGLRLMVGLLEDPLLAWADLTAWADLLVWVAPLLAWADLLVWADLLLVWADLLQGHHNYSAGYAERVYDSLRLFHELIAKYSKKGLSMSPE